MSTRTFSNTNTTVFAQPKAGVPPPGPVYFPSSTTTGDVVCSPTGTDKNPMINCILPKVFSGNDDDDDSPEKGDICLISRGITSGCLFTPTVENQCSGQIEISTDASGDRSYACTNIMAKFPPPPETN